MVVVKELMLDSTFVKRKFKATALEAAKKMALLTVAFNKARVKVLTKPVAPRGPNDVNSGEKKRSFT